ncbi:MAG TPA: SHOCT domain-containing protein [Acidimicrobiales bacterium]
MGPNFRHGIFFHGFEGGGIRPWALVLMFVFWVAVALVIVALVQNYRREPRHLHHHVGAHGHGLGPDHGLAPVNPVPGNPAIDILKERFARGEVSEEEYSRRLTMLKES